MRSYRLLWLVAATSLLCVYSTGWAEEKPRLNIVFILADDLGINDLHCYGRKDHESPHLDALANQGARFTSAYAQPMCSPSRAALLTGKAPARLHLTTYIPGRADVPSQKVLHPKINQQLPLDGKTIARLLKDAGYATACLGKWHLGDGPDKYGFDMVYAGKSDTTPSDTEGGKGEYDLTKRALQFININKDRPFFLYLAHHSPHIPLRAKPELVKKFKNAFNPTYAAMVFSLDDCVGKMLAKLDELRLAERTLVVFTSDTGGLHVLESGDSPATHNTPFRAGRGFLYEGGVRVPMIVRWPGKIKAGRVIDDPVSSTDWTPTLLEACGVKAPGVSFDGVSLVTLFSGGDAPVRPLFWHYPHYSNQGNRPMGAVREGNWKLIEQYEDGSIELYNLLTDPGETTDLAAKEPKRAADLKAKLASWRKQVGARENTPNPKFDAALHKQLYEDTDVSSLKAAATATEMRPRLQAWRKGMDDVLRGKKGQ
jgi:arylsulfatase A-like enzyme